MKKVILFKEALAMIIQYTIGLVLPWWVVDIINRNLIEGYNSKFLIYSQFNKRIIGLILPWWVPILFESDKRIKKPAFEKQVASVKSSGFTVGMCSNHPYGAYGGYHAIYESPERNKYYCIYCGGSSTNINILTACSCTFHPNGQKSHHRLVKNAKSEKEIEILV